jgi:transposase-like protein
MTYTINQFRKEFGSEDKCLEYVLEKRFPSLQGYYRVKGRKCWANAEGKQIHPLAGTVFEKSSTSLQNWFYAIYLFSASRNGVSAKELQRQLGVTYKTAWRMAYQIRELMKQGGGLLSGGVEIDETYFGGTRRMSSKMENKKAIMGMVERKGNIVAKHIPNRYDLTLLTEIKKNVKKGSHLFTDEWGAYKKVAKLGYGHSSVKHSAKQFARGTTHTNTIEGFWSQFKRSVSGTYHSVSGRHLQSYVNEFSFRYNHRGGEIFSALMGRI